MHEGMKKLLLLFIVYLSLCTNRVHAQSPLPKDFKFDMDLGPKAYSQYVIPCINWLQQMPLDQQKEERARITNFVLVWLQTNPEINIGLPEYSYTFHGINDHLLYMFMASWMKYTIETKDQDITNCRMAGLHGMLDFYNSGKAVGIGKNDFLDNLGAIERNGKLGELFDTGVDAKNTWIYLKAPAQRDYKYNENYLGFSFYCINLLAPRKVIYRYQLKGYYDRWIETKEGSATYPRLPPGEYTFVVQGSMYPDFRKVSEATFSFVISTPVWQKPWFIALIVVLSLGLVLFIIKQREKNLKHIAMLERERMMFEYEHLKSQVNPHFLFNSLNTLTNLIERDPVKAMGYTENLSSLYHSILAHHENDLVRLPEELAILENYFSVQKGRFGDALQLRIDIPDEIRQKGKVVPLALQILAENAIKHNVISKDAPLVISVTANEQEITMRNFVHRKVRPEKGPGLGLANIKRRYELLTSKPVTYGVFEHEFVVTLPLL